MIAEGVKPNQPSTFSYLFRALERQGDLTTMVSYWKYFKELKLTPQALHFHYLMRTANRLHKFSFVHQFYEEFIAHQMQPDPLALELLISTFAYERKIDRMEQTWKTFKEEKFPPNGDIFTSLMVGWDSVDNIGNILQILHEAKDLYSPEIPLQLYQIPLTCCARLAKWNEMDKLLREYLETEYEPSAVLVENILRSLSLAKLQYQKSDASMRTLWNSLHKLCGRATLYQVSQQNKLLHYIVQQVSLWGCYD